MIININNIVDADTDEGTVYMYLAERATAGAYYKVRMSQKEATDLRDSLTAALKLMEPVVAFDNRRTRDFPALTAEERAEHDEMMEDLEAYFEKLNSDIDKGEN